ncbi:MAG: sodium-dependent transporter [Gammaproteobacteria bacterium]|jgi:NSS family neurotransmitter:Na+ symporter|nr:sodium-dependent transporter [Gammaproteobacteria bacterium]MBT6042460.1 sodium-dependent transporter [Gammaproteobacteria bacterium]
MQSNEKHENWSSRWLFVMAAVGSSVGLANIWRFPYTTGENGGGAFVFIYIAAVFFLALPLVIGEFMLGRRGQDCPPEALKKVIKEANASPFWVIIGYMGIFTASLILSYYSMIGGETIYYAFANLFGNFSQINTEEAAAISSGFNGSWFTVLIAHTMFMGITVTISARGISGGLETAVKYMMPMLFIILIGMVVYAAFAGEFATAVAYLFTPDFSRITPSVVIEAFGQAFFSVSVGATTLMAYGSYLSKNDSITDSAAMVVTADTLVAILAGLAIFPIVFAFGLDAGGGPALVFETVPLAFGNMPGGIIFGTLFFVLLAFAAITSSISMLEVPVAWLASKDNWSRKKSAIVSGVIIWLIGFLSVLSLNELQNFHPLTMVGIEGTFFDLFDYLTSNIMLPVTGLLTALFVGWVVPKAISMEELKILREHHWFRGWMIMMRYGVTAVLFIVFYNLVF